MAEERVIAIKLEVDGGDSVQEVEKLEQSLHGYNKAIQQNKQEQLELRKINNEFKRELEGLKNAYKELPKGSMAARKALKTDIDNLTAAIKDNNLALEEFEIDNQKLENTRKGLKLVKDEVAGIQTALDLATVAVAGFGAFQGVVAMLGIENEKTMESLVKVQGAMTTLMSLEQLRRTLLVESALKTKLLTAKTWLMTAAMTAYNFVVGASTGLMKLFRAAMISTGIGALVAGVGLLIANFEKLTKWLGFSTDETKDNTEALKENKEAVDALDSALDESTSNIEKQTDRKVAAIQREIDIRKLEGESTIELEKRKIQVQKNSLAEQQRESEKAAKLKARASGQSEKELAENLLEIQRDYAEKRVALNHKINILILQNNKKMLEGIKTNADNLGEEMLNSDNPITALLGAENSALGIADALLADVPELQEDLDSMFTPFEQFYAKLTRLSEDSTQQMINDRINLVGTTINSLGMLTDALNANGQRRINQENLTAKQVEAIQIKMFNRNKALQAAQTAIDGAAAIIGSLATYKGSPAGWVNAAAIATATGLQLANIAKMNYNSNVAAPNLDVQPNNGLSGNSTTDLNVTSTISITELIQTGTRITDIEDFNTTGGG